MDVYQIGLVILIALAISDLIVGVSNDAVNFLNSSIGSRVAPRHVIMIIACLGMLAGVTFSSGMMEVARKGIFHPHLFTMPELMAIFLGVMITDIVLLDLYNTFGLPTSTTVSIVFELLGAAVAVSLLKILEAGQSFGDLVNYINTAKALAIISGILLSVVVAFVTGAFVQFVTRIIFTFEFRRRIRRYGALWGGVALASIIYFILIKGSKGASFLSKENVDWIKNHTWVILAVSFLGSTVVLQALIVFFRTNVLKVIILAGTFAIAMAFAANDLVNFIGVPLAGLSAYQEASGSGDLLNQSMAGLAQATKANTFYLLIAGCVMVLTLWFSRKSRSVTKTELRLGRQDEGLERFESTALSQNVVRVVAAGFDVARRGIPGPVRAFVARRLARTEDRPGLGGDDETAPSWDLVRAAVNLMVASALISFATSLKLPLSTTYVTFMVAMGTSMSDQAWGRESAVYRVTGVLTVIGGWFFTAFMAFTAAALIGGAIFAWGAPAAVVILGLAVYVIFNNHRIHRKREEHDQEVEVFNLRKITDSRAAIKVSFEHAGIFLAEVRQAVSEGLDGLVKQDRQILTTARRRQKKVQLWSNILVANIFKVMRLLSLEKIENTQRYAQIISTLQELAESQRDIVMRARKHVANQHSGLLPDQVVELEQIRDLLVKLLDETSAALRNRAHPDRAAVEEAAAEIGRLVEECDRKQIKRIQDNTSKTRLSILFYGFLRDAHQIAKHTAALLRIFEDPLRLNGRKDG